MRQVFKVNRPALVILCLLQQPQAAHSAELKGRVVDTAGRPVAGAKIRVWRKIQAPGAFSRNEPVLFAKEETLRADDAGRFATPDVFDNTAPVRLVAQADGLLAGRSAWLIAQASVTEIEDIVLPRLRSFVGQVTDSQGAPIEGATVFNRDGHHAVETKTGRTGKFFLEGVPADGQLLFVQKPGYRLTGVVIGGEKSLELRLARSEEPTNPLLAQPSPLTVAQRAVLAHRALDPYLDALTTGGSYGEKLFALRALVMTDPMAAITLLDKVGFEATRMESARYEVFRDWMRGRAAEDWDKIFALAKSWASDDWAATWPIASAGAKREGIDPLWPRDWAASWLAYGATIYLPMTDERRTRQWLEEATALARAGVRPNTKVEYLAIVSEGFSRLADRQRAAAIAREAEAAANELPADQRQSDHVCCNLARAFAPIDLPAALTWLDQVKDDWQFVSYGVWIAVNLARTDAMKAEEVWKHIGNWQVHGHKDVGWRDKSAPDVCFRLAQIDLEAARRVAATVQGTLLKVQTQAAIARALGGETGKKLLREAIADPELRRMQDNVVSRSNASTRLAWFLPLLQEVDPVLGRDVLWEALSLRPLRPTVELLDDEALLCDAALAQMIARYEPAIARALLEPAVRSLPHMDWFQAPQVVGSAGYVDPPWAVELLDQLADPSSASRNEPKNNACLRAAHVIGLAGAEYWAEAGFWEPAR
jgi:hypothetical protein